jgi:hypothetical protein
MLNESMKRPSVQPDTGTALYAIRPVLPAAWAGDLDWRMSSWGVLGWVTGKQNVEGAAIAVN